MGDQLWLDELHRQLIDQNMPRSYVKRFMEEIADHLTDLKEENMEIEATASLGKPKQVASAAVLAYRQRSFLGRHPVAAFVAFAISPVVSLPLFSFAGLLAIVVSGGWLGFIDDSNGIRLGSVGRALLPYLLPFAVNIIPALILSLFYCGLARRCAVGGKWTVVSSVALAIVAAATCFHVTFIGTSGHGSISLCLGVWSVMQTAQFFGFLLMLLAFPWWLSRRSYATTVELATS